MNVFKALKTYLGDLPLEEWGLRDSSPDGEIDRGSPLEQKRQELIQELKLLTTDNEDLVVQVRALAVYLEIVRTTAARGTVKHIESTGKVRTVKVRLK